MALNGTIDIVTRLGDLEMKVCHNRHNCMYAITACVCMPVSPRSTFHRDHPTRRYSQFPTHIALCHSAHIAPNLRGEWAGSGLSVTRVWVKVPIVKDREFICAQWLDLLPSTLSHDCADFTSVPRLEAKLLFKESKKIERDTTCTADEQGGSGLRWASCVDPGGTSLTTDAWLTML